MELAAATRLTEYHRGRYQVTADVCGFETQASQDVVARDMQPSIFSFLQIKELYIKTAQLSADVRVRLLMTPKVPLLSFLSPFPSKSNVPVNRAKHL